MQMIMKTANGWVWEADEVVVVADVDGLAEDELEAAAEGAALLATGALTELVAAGKLAEEDDGTATQMPCIEAESMDFSASRWGHKL